MVRLSTPVLAALGLIADRALGNLPDVDMESDGQSWPPPPSSHISLRLADVINDYMVQSRYASCVEIWDIWPP